MAVITLRDAAGLIRQEADQNRGTRTPFFFIVGAGISHPPLPLATEVTDHCKREAQKYGRVAPSGLDRPIEQYSTWFQLAYPAPLARQEYLRDLIHGKPISEANLRLAHILISRRIATTVVTPNFDDFLSRALTLFGEQYVVCDHPQTTERIDPESAQEIQIVHVHGSYSFYDCCNLAGEVEQRARVAPDTNFTMGFLLDSILRAHSPLVVGYSGWESDVIMSALRRRLQSAMPHNLYWFCYNETEVEALPAWVRDHRNTYIVAPQAVQEQVTEGEKRPPRAEALPAKTVFDEIVRTFELQPPLLTRDPLAFLSDHLRASLYEGVEEAADIYGIKGVVERLERARRIEAEAATGRDVLVQLEQMRNAIRRSDYDEATSIAASVKIEQLEVPELLEVLEILTTSISTSRYFEVPPLPFDTLMRVNYSLREAGAIDDREWRIRTADTLLAKANQYEMHDDQHAEIAALDEVVTRFKDESDAVLQRSVARALADKATTLWIYLDDYSAADIAEQVVTRYGADADFALEVLRSLATLAEIRNAQGRWDDALKAADELVRRAAQIRDVDVSRILRRGRISRAITLLGLARFDEAITETDEVLRSIQHPTLPIERGTAARVFEIRAKALEVAGRIDEALATYDTAVNTLTDDPDKPNAQVGRLLLSKGQLAERADRKADAVSSYETAVNRFAAARSKSLRALGEKAKARLDEMLQRGVSTTEAHN